MSHLNRLKTRFFSSFRSATASKGSKPEMTFQKFNNLPSPYDVIDRNFPGIEKRLSLFEMRRLKEQFELDKPELDSLKHLNLQKSYQIGEKNVIGLGRIELSYNVLSNFPGLKCSSEPSLGSSVTLRIPLESFKFSEAEMKRLTNLFESCINSEHFEFTVSDFPLVSQNKLRAHEVICALVDFIKNNHAQIFEEDLNSLCRLNSKTRKSDTFNIKPSFPIEWIQNQNIQKLKTE